jgi:hypothetical protein
VDAPRIVSHPGDGAGGRISNITVTSYIKFIEVAGARVIPLGYDEPKDRLLEVCVLRERATVVLSCKYVLRIVSIIENLERKSDSKQSQTKYLYILHAE